MEGRSMRLSHTTSVRILYFTLAAAVACRLSTSTLAGEVAFRSAAGSPHRVGADTGRPQVGDCNHDGNLDVVISGQGAPDAEGKSTGRVVVLLGDGRGGLKPAGAPIPIERAGLKLALGRIDGDRHLDLLVAAHDTYAVHVLLGDGRGGFQPAPGSPVGAGAGTRPHTHDLVAGDVNGDGRLDAVTVNADDNNVSVLLGDGTGRFAPSRG